MKRPVLKDPKYEATRTFISIDMDAFYCGVEQKLNPTLKDEPFVVGQKNVAATVSYAARALGIKKLGNLVDIRQNHPQVQIVNGESLAKYRAAGLEIFEFLCGIVTQVERLGLEEFRFEVTAEVEAATRKLKRVFKAADDNSVDELVDTISFKLFDKDIAAPNFFWAANCATFPADHNSFFSAIPPETYIAALFAEDLMAQIKLELGYDCSVGIASSKHIAKMATGCNKPNGCYVVLPGYESEFMAQRPMNSVPGIGYAARITLSEYGLSPTDPISKLHSTVSRQEFCRRFDSDLYDLTMGIDPSTIEHWQGPAQISKEETFSPHIAASKCLDTIKMLVDSLLAQAQIEIIKDGKWTQIPLKFRVSTAPHNIHGQGRRAKSVSLHLDAEPNLHQLAKYLVKTGFSILQKLIDEPLRVLNVALILRT